MTTLEPYIKIRKQNGEEVTLEDLQQAADQYHAKYGRNPTLDQVITFIEVGEYGTQD